MRTFFTWRDIQSTLEGVRNPPWFRIDVSPFEIVISCMSDGISACRDTLKLFVGEAFNVEDSTIALISLQTHRRVIKVCFQEDLDSIKKITVPRPLWNSSLPLGRKEDTDGFALCSFFSYKGGVGRTTALIGVLGSLLERTQKTNILVIDADFEAPGLTWLLAPPNDEKLSFVDALALLHDANDWKKEALPLIVEHVKANRNSVELKKGRREFHFLPAVRNIEQIFKMPVTPEQLIRGRDRAGIIGDFLMALAKALKFDAILVDMRAGVTEFSSPFLLDNRFRATLVTSCNKQSVNGTLKTLENARNHDPQIPTPAIFIGMVPPNGDEVFNKVSESVTEVLDFEEPSPQLELFSDFEEALNQPVYRADFAQELLHYEDLSDLANKLAGTDMGKKCRSLADRLVPIREISSSSDSTNITPQEIAKQAKNLEFAEENVSLGLLSTPPLIRLVTQPGDRLPNNVILGSKGSGKTFAWGQMLLAGTWDKFVGLFDKDSRNHAKIFPLLAPASMHENLRDRVNKAETDISATALTTIGQLRRKLENCDKIGDALEFWICEIANRLEISLSNNSVRELSKAVKEKFGLLILAVDGLEEAFQVAPDKPLNEGQKKILRALLQDLPNALREMNCLNLGLVTFIRRDLAANAITQNYYQFESSHQDTMLTWSVEDALRLLHWFLNKSGWQLMKPELISNAPYDALRKQLIPFWGEKLGGKKEAFTDKWVIAALSDLNLVIQARDLIRLIRYAAEQNQQWPLSAKTIKDALPKVSEIKISELSQEVLGLKELFKKLQEQPLEKRQVPFLPEDIKLSLDEVKFLEQQGLVSRLPNDEKYHMPEIIRHGLGYKIVGPGKAKVVALYRAALTRKGL